MKYNICGIPITKEHALRIAQTGLKIMINFPSGNRQQDFADVQEARRTVNRIETDIRIEAQNENELLQEKN